MNENTRDLSSFGWRELKMAAELLTALVEQGKPDELWEGIAVEFNPNSGHVFLVDEDFNVALLNGDKLETWFHCGECGLEGFAEDINADDEHFIGEHGGVEHGTPDDDEDGAL
jgi:hypothetical protein